MSNTRSDDAQAAVYRYLRETRRERELRPDTPEGNALAGVLSSIGSCGTEIRNLESQVSRLKRALRDHNVPAHEVEEIARGYK